MRDSHPDFDRIVRAYRDRYGVDLSHMRMKWSKHPVYNDGRRSYDFADDETGGSWVDDGTVRINPKMGPVMKRFGIEGMTQAEFRRRLIAHELAHEIWRKQARKAKVKRLMMDVLAKAREESFTTPYLKTVPERKMDEETFAEYMSDQLNKKAESAEELASELKKRLKYGIRYSDGTYETSPDMWDKRDANDIVVQTPEELDESGIGMCHDVTRALIKALRKRRIKHVAMMLKGDAEPRLPTHSFVVSGGKGKYTVLDPLSYDTGSKGGYKSVDEAVADRIADWRKEEEKGNVTSARIPRRDWKNRALLDFLHYNGEKKAGYEYEGIDDESVARHKKGYRNAGRIRLLKTTRGTFILKDGKLAGFVNTERKDDGRTWVQALEVAPEFRRQGIARKLLAKAVDDYGATDLTVRKTNQAARKLYDSEGWVPYKEEGIMEFRKKADDASDDETRKIVAKLIAAHWKRRRPWGLRLKNGKFLGNDYFRSRDMEDFDDEHRRRLMENGVVYTGDKAVRANRGICHDLASARLKMLLDRNVKANRLYVDYESPDNPGNVLNHSMLFYKDKNGRYHHANRHIDEPGRLDDYKDMDEALKDFIKDIVKSKEARKGEPISIYDTTDVEMPESLPLGEYIRLSKEKGRKVYEQGHEKKAERLYTYLPKDNTADVDGILSTALTEKGWEKYRGRTRRKTRDAVLKALDAMEPDWRRSMSVSALAEPIPEDAADDLREFAESSRLYSFDLDDLVKAKLLKHLRETNKGKGTHEAKSVSKGSPDWKRKPGKLLFQGIPHYMVETEGGRIPSDLIRSEN